MFETMCVGVLLLGVAMAAGVAPLNVLFVGNSFTFVNNLPDQLVNIGKSKGIEIQVISLIPSRSGWDNVRGPCTTVHGSSVRI
jgi:hypothetical protein